MLDEQGEWADMLWNILSKHFNGNTCTNLPRRQAFENHQFKHLLNQYVPSLLSYLIKHVDKA